jgi:hypothetical protein
MRIELEDEKNLKLRQWIKRKKNSSSLEAVTAPSSSLPASSSSLSTTPQTEVFDSSSDNAISEMKEVADMGLDEMAKIFSNVEENSSSIKNTDPETLGIAIASRTDIAMSAGHMILIKMT